MTLGVSRRITVSPNHSRTRSTGNRRSTLNSATNIAKNLRRPRASRCASRCLTSIGCRPRPEKLRKIRPFTSPMSRSVTRPRASAATAASSSRGTESSLAKWLCVPSGSTPNATGPPARAFAMVFSVPSPPPAMTVSNLSTAAPRAVSARSGPWTFLTSTSTPAASKPARMRSTSSPADELASVPAAWLRMTSTRIEPERTGRVRLREDAKHIARARSGHDEPQQSRMNAVPQRRDEPRQLAVQRDRDRPLGRPDFDGGCFERAEVARLLEPAEQGPQREAHESEAAGAAGEVHAQDPFVQPFAPPEHQAVQAVAVVADEHQRRRLRDALVGGLEDHAHERVSAKHRDHSRQHRAPFAGPEPLLLAVAAADEVRVEPDRRVVHEPPAVHVRDVDLARATGRDDAD